MISQSPLDRYLYELSLKPARDDHEKMRLSEVP